MFVLSKNVSSLINFGINLCVLFVFCLFDGVTFTWKFLLLIYPMCCLVTFNLGMGLILSALYIMFKDLKYLYDIFTLLLMYVSAIFYSIDAYPLEKQYLFYPDHSKEKVVTFLGRITMQKGPEYFVEAAALVLKRTRNIRFVMAGSGDMLDAMINLAAERGIADRFHFPGFQRGRQVYEAYKNSDVFVMPSVSEPFGIAPLEAMQCGTPSIISKQSGCGEILDKVIKTDYWDINAMADAIYSICTNPSLFQYLQEEGKKEVDGITWEKVGLRIRALYEQVLKNYGK